MGLYQSKAKKSAKDEAVEEGRKFLAEEAAGEGERSEAEVYEDGSFSLG